MSGFMDLESKVVTKLFGEKFRKDEPFWGDAGIST